MKRFFSWLLVSLAVVSFVADAEHRVRRVGLVAGGGGGPITHVQTATDNIGSATSDTLAYGSNVSAGSLLVMSARVGDVDGDKTWTVSDSVNGSWTRANGVFLSGHGELEIWYFPNAASGATTVTLSFGGSASSIRWSIHEYSGVATSSPLEQNNSASGANGLPNNYDVTTTAANQLLFGVLGLNVINTVSPEPDFTLRAQVPAAPNTRYATQDRIVSSAGTYAAEFSYSDTSNSWIAAVATFKAQ
jgi:hypothetical protein